MLNMLVAKLGSLHHEMADLGTVPLQVLLTHDTSLAGNHPSVVWYAAL